MKKENEKKINISEIKEIIQIETKLSPLNKQEKLKSPMLTPLTPYGSRIYLRI